MGRDLEIHIRRKDGSALPVDVALSSLQVSSISLVVATIRDASRRLEMEAAVEEREHRLRQLYARAPLFILGLDAHGAITDCNPVLCRLLGGEDRELIGRPVTDVMAGLGIDITDAIEAGYLRHEGVIAPPGRRPRRIGWHTVALRGSSGETTGILAVGEDLTDRTRQQRSITAMTAVTGAILEGQNPSRIQELICNEAAAIADASVALVASRPDGQVGYVVEAAVGLEVAPTGDVAPALETMLDGLALDESSVVDLSAVGLALGRALGPATLLTLPGESGRGFLFVADDPGAPPFDLETVQALDVFTFQASLALAYGRRLRTIAVADDRDRIARDMHDLIIQRLFAAGLSLQASAQTIGSPEVSARLNDVVDSLDEAIAELRRSIFSLESRKETGFRGRVVRLVEDATAHLDLVTSVEVEHPPNGLPEDKVGDLLATLREALTNTARHANARRVEVEVEIGSELVLVVRDDGDGIPEGNASTGHGLTNMERRARQSGGELVLAPKEGGGLELTWRIPL